MHHQQSKLRTLVQALGLELKRQWVWMSVVAGVLLLTSLLGNAMINVARAEFLRQLNHTSGQSFVSLGRNGLSQAQKPNPPALREKPRLLAHLKAALQGYEGVPEEGEQVRALFLAQGMQFTNDTLSADVVLIRQEPKDGRMGFEVRAANGSEVMDLTAKIRAAADLDERERLEGFLAKHPEFPRTPEINAEPEQVAAQIKRLTQTAPLLLRMLLAVGVVLMMTFIGSASLGLEWDLRRAASTLEPWALTPQPTWILYGSQLAARCLVGVLAVVTWAMPTFFLTPEISLFWATIATGSLLLFVIGLSTLVGMWGLLSTMLFHHRYGRLLGRLLLSPISLGALTMFRVSLAVEAVNRVGDWMHGRLTEYSWWSVAGGVALTGLLMLTAGLALAPLVNARIGRRRQGLRKL